MLISRCGNSSAIGLQRHPEQDLAYPAKDKVDRKHKPQEPEAVYRPAQNEDDADEGRQYS